MRLKFYNAHNYLKIIIRKHHQFYTRFTFLYYIISIIQFFDIGDNCFELTLTSKG